MRRIDEYEQQKEQTQGCSDTKFDVNLHLDENPQQVYPSTGSRTFPLLNFDLLERPKIFKNIKNQTLAQTQPFMWLPNPK